MTPCSTPSHHKWLEAHIVIVDEGDRLRGPRADQAVRPVLLVC